MLNEREELFNDVLRKIAESLDISPTNFKRAKKAYEAVGKYLEGEDYPELDSIPDIYPQGSFRLGTVVKPVTDEDEYDIDLVCQLGYEKQSKTQKFVKEVVGEQLDDHGTYNGKLDKEKRRCWRINYAEGSDGIKFHMDILPCVQEDDITIQTLVNNGIPRSYAQYAIGITDKDNWNYQIIDNEWPSSNPNGYVEWFDNIKKCYPDYTSLSMRQKQAIYENTLNKEGQLIFASLDEVPEPLVRTPLQRAIQLLKRHRDLRFDGLKNSEHKPISMVITTLSAKAYGNETEVYTALMKIVTELTSYEGLFGKYDERSGLIQKQDGKWYIPNPVNLAENFADRWHEDDHAKAKAFFQWLGWLKEDINTSLDAHGLHDISESLCPAFGENTVNTAFKRLGTSYREERESGKLKVAFGTGILGSKGDATVKGHTFYGS